MGSYSIEELEEAINGDFESFAKNYFLWFNQGTDALYHKQIAKFALWNLYKWSKPTSPEEAGIAQNIARHFELARMLDNSLPLPSDAWKNVCALNGFPYLNMNENADEQITNFGYLKNKITYPLPLGYALTVFPAFYKQNMPNTVVLTDGAHKISIQVVEEEQPGHIHDPRTMLETIDFQDEINGYLYVGAWDNRNAANGDYGFIGFIQGFASFVSVNITFKSEDEKEWVLSTFKSFITPAAPALKFEMLDNKEN